MATFLNTRGDATRLAALLADLDRRLQALERTSQASFRSLDGGALDVYDEGGVLRGRIGVQPDGTVGVVPHNSPPPPTPTPPALEPVLAGLLVTWDGQWEDAYGSPSDLAAVQVHLGTKPDFLPDLSTLAGVVTNLEGGTVSLATADYAAAWVRLVAVNTAQVTGSPSAAVEGVPRQLDGPDLSALIDLAERLKDESVAGSKLVREAIGADQLAANAVVAGKVDAGVITGREIAAKSVEGEHVRAGSLDATHIKAGSITAENIAADALNGRTITGTTVQTGTAGARLVLDTAMKLYNADGVLAAEAKLADGTTDVGFAAYNTSGLGRYYAMLSRGYVQFGKAGTEYGGVPSVDHLISGGTVSTLRLGSGTIGTSGGEAQMWLAGGSSDGASRPHVDVASSTLDGRCDLAVSGMLTASNIVTGTVPITPSAPNVPQSVTVTGLNVPGKQFRGFVSAMSSVPGTGLVACTATDVTSNGLTIWLTRKDKVKTTVNWLIIGS